MNLLVLVNDAQGITPRQSTAGLLATAAERGHAIRVCGVGDLAVLPDGRIAARARTLRPGDPARTLPAMARRTARSIDVSGVDAVWIRTNPARDPRAWAHEGALVMLSMARRHGVVVVSDPDTLLRAGSKVYLSTLPADTRPATLVSADPERILAFVEEHDGRAVLKPARGTRGSDVFLITPDSQFNLHQIVDVVTRGGFAMAQQFVPEAADGDVRLILVDGELLEVGGQAAAVRRVPAEGGEFRSNVHVGGTAHPAEVTPAMRDLAARVGPILRGDGVFLAGLDLIGDVIVEANVFSPGGIVDAGAFHGVDFVHPVIEALEQRVSARRPSTS